MGAAWNFRFSSFTFVPELPGNEAQRKTDHRGIEADRVCHGKRD